MKSNKNVNNKIWIFYIILILYSCTKHNKSKVIGLFSKDKDFFEFTGDSLNVYKFKDSIIYKHKLKYKKELLKTEDESYVFNILNNDSIVLKSFNNNAILKKIKYNDFDIKELNNTEWQVQREVDSINFYIRIRHKGILNIYKLKKEDIAGMSYSSYYITKLYNKFHFYHDVKFLIISYYKRDDMVIQFIKDDQWNEIKLKKVNTTIIDKKLIGNWVKIKGNRGPIIPFNEYEKNTDFNTLKFTSKGFLYRTVFFIKDSLILKEKISYNKDTKYIFINDFSNSNVKSFEEDLYYEIIKLTKDTLKLRISNGLLNTYVKHK